MPVQDLPGTDDKRRVCSACTCLVESEIPGCLDNIGVEVTARPEDVILTGAGVDIQVVVLTGCARLANGTGHGSKSYAAANNVRSKVAGRIDDGGLGLEVHVSVCGLDHIHVHVAKYLVQVDVVPGSGSDSAFPDDVQLKIVTWLTDPTLDCVENNMVARDVFQSVIQAVNDAPAGANGSQVDIA